MTAIIIAGFGIATGLALILTSYAYSKQNTEPFIFGAGTILLMLTGLVILANPISYTTGTIEIVNNLTTTITNTYTTASTTINTATGTILTLLGLFGTGSAITRFRLNKTREEREDTLNFDD